MLIFAVRLFSVVSCLACKLSVSEGYVMAMCCITTGCKQPGCLFDLCFPRNTVVLWLATAADRIRYATLLTRLY